MREKKQEYVAQFDFEKQERIFDGTKPEKPLTEERVFPGIPDIPTATIPNKNRFDEYLRKNRRPSYGISRYVKGDGSVPKAWVVSAVGIIVISLIVDSWAVTLWTAGILVLVGLTAVLPLSRHFKEQAEKQFRQYNETVAWFVQENGWAYGWKCPCCHQYNKDMNRCCPTCGVYPRLVPLEWTQDEEE